ncbi:MAG TPA: ribosomal protein S18-alanine N-acetyltransferase [Burkholderiales bacterium]|nr:ribosomal protein S18-alanine N-acetyltransferase [Burkholderiales bacterium]
MSAVLSDAVAFRPMRVADLDAILLIEQDIYTHPWTYGNFRDSLQAGYSCWVMECGGRLSGYGVLMIGVNEAHLLNLSVAGSEQRRGLGRTLLHHFIDTARACQAERLFLEVRPSNRAARALYDSTGFRELYVRRNYYPAGAGREDAILMGLDL